ncbi:hypothetical protein WICPIJ_009092, partial [Wickerhamomyces pijperi]
VLKAEKEMESQGKSQALSELAAITSSIEVDKKLLADKSKQLEELQVKQVNTESQLKDKELKYQELEDIHHSSNSSTEKERLELAEKIALLTQQVESHSKGS